jgi:hypothetical protein
MLGGCSTYQPNGGIVTSVKGPITAAAGSMKYSKTGRAQANTILGIVATGDYSIATAAKNAGITKIKYVDVEVFSVLGCGTYTTIVYGD